MKRLAIMSAQDVNQVYWTVIGYQGKFVSLQYAKEWIDECKKKGP
jgi:hypothetical protein